MARKLRKNMTKGAVLLWKLVKENRFLVFDFDRQRCIDNYIVDFYCKELMLAIEIDGVYHTYDEAFLKDEIRQNKLESLGVKFIRFTEAEMGNDIVNVARALEAVIISIIKHDPSANLPKDFDSRLLDS
ncbi:MAG: endonuclease domain-containing protein [Mucilaginibacter sp.]